MLGLQSLEPRHKQGEEREVPGNPTRDGEVVPGGLPREYGRPRVDRPGDPTRDGRGDLGWIAQGISHMMEHGVV